MNIKRNMRENEQPPYWRPLICHDREMSASITCPKGHYGIITDHTIAADGTVTPSVVCPDCDFHEMIKLDGWENRKRDNMEHIERVRTRCKNMWFCHDCGRWVTDENIAIRDVMVEQHRKTHGSNNPRPEGEQPSVDGALKLQDKK